MQSIDLKQQNENPVGLFIDDYLKIYDLKVLNLYKDFQQLSTYPVSQSQLENISSNNKTQLSIILEFQAINANYFLKGEKIKIPEIKQFQFSQLPTFGKLQSNSNFLSTLSQEKILISGIKLKCEQVSPSLEPISKDEDSSIEINEYPEKIIKINEIDKFNNNLRKRKYDPIHQFNSLEKKFSNKFADIEEQEPLKIQFEQEESALNIVNDLLNYGNKGKGKAKLLTQRYNKFINNCQYDFLGILSLSDLYDIIWKGLMNHIIQIFNNTFNSTINSGIISILKTPLEQINSIDELADINEKILKSELALKSIQELFFENFKDNTKNNQCNQNNQNNISDKLTQKPSPQILPINKVDNHRFENKSQKNQNPIKNQSNNNLNLIQKNNFSSIKKPPNKVQKQYKTKDNNKNASISGNQIGIYKSSNKKSFHTNLDYDL